MENATKALLIAASLLIGMVILAIFVYQMSFVANTTETINSSLKEKEVLEYNAKFEAYANRGLSGYLSDVEENADKKIQNAISFQEFGALLNLISQSNLDNLSDPITFKIMPKDAKSININANVITPYLKDRENKLKIKETNPNVTVPRIEELFMEINKKDNNELEKYYLILTGDKIKYENTGGRISYIELELHKYNK